MAGSINIRSPRCGLGKRDAPSNLDVRPLTFRHFIGTYANHRLPCDRNGLASS
jgi:hypothetical protein